jgi:hypothetical protein
MALETLNLEKFAQYRLESSSLKHIAGGQITRTDGGSDATGNTKQWSSGGVSHGSSEFHSWTSDSANSETLSITYVGERIWWTQMY